MNARSRRTRLRLQAALRDLLAEKPLSAISIDALARRAGVTRPTVYAHYSGLPALLEDHLDALLSEIEARHAALLDDAPCADLPARLQALVTSVFADIDRDDPRLRALLEGVPGLDAEARFAALVERLIPRGDPAGASACPEARRLHAHFFTGAFVGLLRLWLARPPRLDAPAMGRAFSELALRGRLGADLRPQDAS